MDESWQTPIGSVVPRLTSTTEKEARRSRRSGKEGLHPDDFRDVFGGPPRTVLLRRFSGELSAGRVTFYDEIFRTAGESSLRVARNLPGFSIPSSMSARGRLLRTEEGFYDDIFGSGSGGDRRSRSTSGSEDTSSPLRPEDAMLSSITSRLRPITIPARRRPSSSSSMPSTTSSEGGKQSNHRTTPTIPCSTPRSCFMDFQDDNNSSSSSKSTTHLFRQQQRSHHPCCLSLEPISFIRGGCRGLKKHRDDDDDVDTDNSPSSVISSAFTNQLATNHRPSATHKWAEQEQELEEAVVQAASEEGSSTSAKNSALVIRMDGIHCSSIIGGGEAEGAAALMDEAIAWAKHKFWNQTSNGFDEVENGETHDLLGEGKVIESTTCPRKP